MSTPCKPDSSPAQRPSDTAPTWQVARDAWIRALQDLAETVRHAERWGNGVTSDAVAEPLERLERAERDYFGHDWS